ncbi:red chlorophyll catabolite reductase [Plectonema cf. radiosum LEGE 06105]|uniref:Red chlorophyll catabolite reductase n=1 Tax=Plectonema cf. radiosum LEGE 06105 TaxID=945769 RepID=A0A8J7F9L3_9CYAN|nr:red chlorophyll catabolite reductase [Plectonema radiosum]MBE9214159.1 red chlorophyll catabolite reductase [Plectonema cf. radiosum LEGE 06105]
MADSKDVFEQLWAITCELKQKIERRFDLQPEPSTEDLKEYSSQDGNLKGSLNAFQGKEIDWLVHSWLGNPGKSNFNTMRLTVWLSSHIQVPHLVFEFGTLPNILFYMDYIPRTDLYTDLEYINRYYEPVNETFLKLQANPDLTSFTSKSAYIRSFQSPVSLCYTCLPNNDTLNLIRTVALEMFERWLKWVDEAPTVTENMRSTLTERDLFIRRSSAECDPGNKMAAQMLGTQLTDKLVKALWGGLLITDNC